MTPAEGEYPKTVVLRDGAHLVLRPRVPADGGALRALAAGVPAAARDACAEAAGGTIAVVAWDGERAAGVARLSLCGTGGEGAAAVAVAVDPAYAGRRLGTWLLLDTVHLAAGLGLARLIAEPAGGADDYRAALQRLDFVPAAGEAAPGRLVKTLHRGWTDF